MNSIDLYFNKIKKYEEGNKNRFEFVKCILIYLLQNEQETRLVICKIVFTLR